MSSFFRFRTVSLTALLLGLLGLARADVLTVGPTAVFAEVQTAVDAAADGDTILVARGNYASFSIVDKAVTVVADTGADVFVDGPLAVAQLAAHLGRGPYTSLERRAYLPQWLQHEFFQHLFRTWPEFKLEARSHQWFDRSKWPRDFEGRLEGFAGTYLREPRENDWHEGEVTPVRRSPWIQAARPCRPSASPPS
jgi:hypothetical protein